MPNPGSLAPRLTRGAVAASRLPLVTRLAAEWALGPTAEPWGTVATSVPDDLLTAPGLPPESVGICVSWPPLVDFRLRNPGPVVWSREVQGRGPRGPRAAAERLLVDARLAQVDREAERIAVRRAACGDHDPRGSSRSSPPPSERRPLASASTAIGIAAYDERWHFEDSRDRVCGEPHGGGGAGAGLRSDAGRPRIGSTS